jgi:hypothetical protein
MSQPVFSFVDNVILTSIQLLQKTAAPFKPISNARPVNPQSPISSSVSLVHMFEVYNADTSSDREHIGGSDDLAALNQAGQLKKIIARAAVSE